MAGDSDIEWTDATWNPIAGCSMVSPGCTNCYAMRMAARLQAMGLEKYKGLTRKSGGRAVWTGKTRVDPKSLDAPLRWRKPRLVFVNSMSDLFHEGVSESVAEAVWSVMEQARWHQFQVLTKRPERMAAFLKKRGAPAPNVWIGTSIESMDQLDRLDHLRTTPAAVRFVSFEPLLGPIAKPNLSGFHWIIVGGESGPGARPMEERWVLDLLKAARKYRAAFFFKQWGGRLKKKTGRKLGGRTYDEMPMLKSFAVAAE
jgi:protein gp37